MKPTETITQTDFSFSGQTAVYRGKVRDIYTINNELMVMVATDRISAFDVILPKGIPYKGQILNQMAWYFLQATKHIVPNWTLACPHPNVTVGIKCNPFKVEMVIRGYLTGHAWRQYRTGVRMLCGVSLPDGMKENDPFPEPIITPSTKADEGHDEDISRDEIIAQGLVDEASYTQLETYTRALFAKGTEMAAEKGLILVDTKYEFGRARDQILLIDEIHTPDSSRYFYAEGFEERQKNGEAQKQLSKEFVRQWLIEHDFQGKDGQQMPPMPDDFVESISDRYQELFEKIIGTSFTPTSYDDISTEIEKAVNNSLADLQH